ncbi:MAG TPA: aminoglycoside phosphotransferase family protein [Candidatus Binataceae bacterium]|nr:aminoglycoside phosphotransferase family protein [Candidatus Binataceae bacterium]
MDASKVDALIRSINHARDVEYTLVERANSGESGAWIIVDPAERRFILKAGSGVEFRPKVAADITKTLRSLDYPAPQYELIGSFEEDRYAIQELMPGARLLDRELTPQIISRLVELTRIQRGRSDSPNAQWKAELKRSLTEGFQDYCRLDALREDSPDFLQFLQGIVEANLDAPHPANDIVHWDFHQGNILVEGNRVTGVVDWDGVRTGDASFDLATLLFYLYPHPEVRKPFHDEALAHSSRGAFQIYLAHMIIRQLDWSIRNHPPPTLAYFRGIADGIVRDFLS